MRRVSRETTEAFVEQAGSLVTADEARNNLALGILSSIASHPVLYPEVLLWLAEDGDAVVAAALRTPPFNLVLPRPLEISGVVALAGGIDDELPGVTGGLPEVQLFAEARCTRKRRRPRVRAQGIYSLERVIPVTGVPGAMRAATVEDRPLVEESYGVHRRGAAGAWQAGGRGGGRPARAFDRRQAR